MRHTENTRINQFFSDLSLTEATIILQSLLALNHKLLDELADYANTANYDHFEETKDSLVAVSSMIDKITSIYDVKMMEKEEE